MATIRVPYLAFRDGRPRWIPGPRLRAKGFKGRDLKDDAGNWLGLEAAIDAAKKLNAEVEAFRESGKVRFRERAPRRNPRCCEALYEQWLASPGFARKAASTQRDYKGKARIFLNARIDDRSTFGDMPVAAINGGHLYKWWEEIYRDRGHAMANGTMAVVRAMFSHAQPKRLNWRIDNPASRLDLEGVPPRVCVWSPSEVAHFVETADATGHHAVADAVIIALHTGQRQGDVLLLQDAGVVNGRSIFRQGKTGARVSVPFTPALRERLGEIRRRRLAELGDVPDLGKARRLVVALDGEDYTSDGFRKHFRKVRAAAATGNFVSLADKQFLDLRHTAVTRLALAGCTVAEIRPTTGHTLNTVHKVLQHYLALDDRMADAGIAKLKVWMAEEGMAV